MYELPGRFATKVSGTRNWQSFITNYKPSSVQFAKVFFFLVCDLT